MVKDVTSVYDGSIRLTPGSVIGALHSKHNGNTFKAISSMLLKLHHVPGSGGSHVNCMIRRPQGWIDEIQYM